MDWALAARPGDPVGLMGPSGGGVPQGDRLILAGDETAYPAIARFLETRAGNARGQVWLLGQSADYPLPETPEFEVLHRPGGESQLAAMLEPAPCRIADLLWVGGERRAIEPLRRLAADKMAPDGLFSHVSAFWTA
ncbi:siderophore-interacting protein [Paracoccus sp. DMF-8]|uniref:siderophore-interacting protein n=1 Tax=Paracoccus sp. DMF-8 TaxID=3019445 RepID=UPI0023E8FBDD|nr:siderophore-interacting protein [Paracoccus sp. DMF-8]MDF3604834.1 siderophore-interacting protein [Paracoccus sp. DMF-8]